MLGGWIIGGEVVLGVHPPRLVITAHVHLLPAGFLLMIVMGVAGAGPERMTDVITSARRPA